MSLRLGALHDALLNPGDANLALKAAEEVAAYENRFSRVESRLDVLTWMTGTLIPIAVGNLWLTFNVLGRLPR